jgi:UDP-glucose 4-epimerase
MRRQYLVTGGCGFIGSHLVDALLAAGHAVRVVDDLSTGRREQLDPRAELRVADVSRPEVVDAAVADVDGIFHLAAVASVVRCNEAWLETHAVNQTATLRLLDAARRLQTPPVPVVYASSAAVYGDRAEAVDETTPLAPLSSYGADKAAGELHAGAAARVHGVASFGLRFFNVYGPRQRPDDAYAGVISIFSDRIRRGRPLTIFGDGEQSRDFVFVADVVRALEAAMAGLERDPTPRAEIANVATGRATSVRGLADTLMAVHDRRVAVSHAAPRAGDIRTSLACTRRMGERLGLVDTVAIDAGLRALVAA